MGNVWYSHWVYGAGLLTIDPQYCQRLSLHCKNTGGIHPPLWWMYTTTSNVAVVVNILVVYGHRGSGYIPPPDCGVRICYRSGTKPPRIAIA